MSVNDRISVREWIERYEAGEWDAPDVATQIVAGWYDWFCRDHTLVGKTKKLGEMVKALSVTGAINLDCWYVWFKNNCPMNGTLYDDIRFARLNDHKPMLVVVPKSGHTSLKNRGEVWDFRDENNEKEQPVAVGSFNDLLYYLGNNK